MDDDHYEDDFNESLLQLTSRRSVSVSSKHLQQRQRTLSSSKQDEFDEDELEEPSQSYRPKKKTSHSRQQQTERKERPSNAEASTSGLTSAQLKAKLIQIAKNKGIIDSVKVIRDLLDIRRYFKFYFSV